MSYEKYTTNFCLVNLTNRIPRATHKPFSGNKFSRRRAIPGLRQPSEYRPRTTQSLRWRFRPPDEKAESASRIIKDTIQENRIKLDDPESTAKQYAKYIPFWA